MILIVLFNLNKFISIRTNFFKEYLNLRVLKFIYFLFIEINSLFFHFQFLLIIFQFILKNPFIKSLTIPRGVILIIIIKPQFNLVIQLHFVPLILKLFNFLKDIQFSLLFVIIKDSLY